MEKSLKNSSMNETECKFGIKYEIVHIKSLKNVEGTHNIWYYTNKIIKVFVRSIKHSVVKDKMMHGTNKLAIDSSLSSLSPIEGT